MRLHRRSILPLALAALSLASVAAVGGALPQDGVVPRVPVDERVAPVPSAPQPATSGAAVPDLVVTGRVVDDRDGTPLHGVQIHFRGVGIGTLTDRSGRYALRLPDGLAQRPDARLVAVLIGYHEAEARLPVLGGAAGDSVAVDFRLKARSLVLDELVVTESAAGAVRTRAGLPVARPATPPGQAKGASPQIASAEVLYRQGSAPHPGWPGRGHHRPVGDREQYAHIAENPFRSVEDHPLSTFSIDVDRASYSNVRRFLLREGRLPPVDAVQIEEMINYFSYDYARPKGNAPVAVTTEVGAAPWAPEHRLLRVGIASRPVATADMPPANLVFLLDVSGSMASPDKLPLVQASMGLLVDQMRPQDRVAIVVYAGAAGVVLEPTSGSRGDAIHEAIGRLSAGGSTAGGEGLRLAYHVARKSFRPEGNNRVILATDGDFNVGESSDGAMIRLIQEKRAQGTFLTVLGFGTGNLQSEKMQQLAQHGNGNYAYIDGLHEARKVLVGEMGGTLLTVARDVKIQIEFNPARVRGYRLLGYENRLLAAEDFNDDAKDAGELGAGHTVTALYEIVPTGVASDVLPGDVDPLRYQDPRGVTRPSGGDESQRGGGGARSGIDGARSGGDESRRGGDELAFVKVRYKQPSGGDSRLLEHPVADADGRHQASRDFRFAAAVAGFGMLLRQSEYRGSMSADRVLALAEDGMGADADGYRAGFLELVRAYQQVTRGQDRAGMR